MAWRGKGLSSQHGFHVMGLLNLDLKTRKIGGEKSTPLLDVASILARRKAMEYSDSESEAGNSDESGSDNWNDDESEC